MVGSLAASKAGTPVHLNILSLAFSARFRMNTIPPTSPPTRTEKTQLFFHCDARLSLGGISSDSSFSIRIRRSQSHCPRGFHPFRHVPQRHVDAPDQHLRHQLPSVLTHIC